MHDIISSGMLYIFSTVVPVAIVCIQKETEKSGKEPHSMNDGGTIGHHATLHPQPNLRSFPIDVQEIRIVA